MDRQIVYPGVIPQDTDFLLSQKSIMIALGWFMQGCFGTESTAVGLACAPTSPATMSVTVGPGGISQLTTVDNLSFGSLGAETGIPLLKMGINQTYQTLVLTAPSGSGLSQTYLITATFGESYAGSEVLPYVNAANPSVPFSGPANDGAAQYTQIVQTATLNLIAGTPSATPLPPAVPYGEVALWYIHVANGATSITSDNISQVPSAPFPPYSLTELSPGTSHMSVFTPTTGGGWTVPAGVQGVKVRVWGGGGSGGNGFTEAGGGGAGGGYSEGYYAVSPGETFAITVGNGGSGGSNGGNSSFGTLATATGGEAGGNGSTGGYGVGGLSAGTGTGSGMTVTGATGSSAFGASSSYVSGAGGGSFGVAGAGSVSGTQTGTFNGLSGTTPGAGGSGAVGSGLGGNGGAGQVIIEW